MPRTGSRIAVLAVACAFFAVPALAQVYDIGTRFMIDSRGIVPMQEFIDRDRFDLTALEPPPHVATSSPTAIYLVR